jgi:hypothetical protein
LRDEHEKFIDWNMRVVDEAIQKHGTKGKPLDCPWREATDEQLTAAGLKREDIRKSYLKPRTPEKLAQELLDLYDQQHALRKDADAKYASLEKELKHEKIKTAVLTSIVTAAAFKGFGFFFVWLASLR